MPSPMILAGGSAHNDGQLVPERRIVLNSLLPGRPRGAGIACRDILGTRLISCSRKREDRAQPAGRLMGELTITTGQRTDRRDQPAFTSKAQRRSEGTRAALEAPEYDSAIPNSRQEICTVLNNRAGSKCNTTSLRWTWLASVNRRRARRRQRYRSREMLRYRFREDRVERRSARVAMLPSRARKSRTR
jgi:hypothetical protein